MTDDQRQIVLGGLLGNKLLTAGDKNSYLTMRHSTTHLSWLQTKAADLMKYGAATPWHIRGTTASWRSVAHDIFTDIYKLCYPNGKKTISMEWLDQLRALGIAVWYGDSGILMGRGGKNACLRTQSFGLEGNKIIEQYFNEVHIPCNLNKSRESYVVVFTVPGTDKLIRMIADILPKNRYSKLVAE